MKKVFALGFLLSLLLSLVVGCGKISTEDMFKWANIRPVDIYHVKGGTVTEWTINDEQQLADLAEWFSGLSLVKKQFAKGQNPGDKEGGEIYRFTLNGINASFTYGIYGADGCYVISDEWYVVKNPSNPFKD